jgi:hypothetical protein
VGVPAPKQTIIITALSAPGITDLSVSFLNAAITMDATISVSGSSGLPAVKTLTGTGLPI